MKTKMSTLTIFFILFAASLLAQTLYNNIGHIPSAYQERWNSAGLLRDMSFVEPKLVINVADLSGNDDQKVQTALNQARNHVNSTGGLAIIYFPTGTYNFEQTIQIVPNDSNIVFQGEGSDKTNLRWTSAYNAFKISGAEDGNWIDLSQDFNKDDSVMHNASGEFSSLQPGDWIQFAQHNFVSAGEDAAPDAVGQISQVETVAPSGNWVEIKDVANRNYAYSSNSYYNTRLRKINPVRNIGIEDLTISRAYHNVASETIYNIYFLYAVNCWAKGVDSDFTQRHHLAASRSSHIEISGCYFHEAAQYSGGGYGYGVVLAVCTTNCLIENNIFETLRHAMVAAEGSNCNVWTFNYSTDQVWEFSGSPWNDPTNRDLDLHAKYPFGHLFEHNIVEKIGSHAATGHGENGPYNTFVRNMATQHIAVLEEMEDWSTLGNMQYQDNLLYPLRHDWDHQPNADIYGFLSNYTTPASHNVAYYFGPYSSYRLDDVSYFYSSKPVFLDGYTWPAIGPETRTSGALCYSIPAEDRYNNSKKTYLPNPTPKPLTYSGTLPYSQTWSGAHALTGDVTVPSGITLTIDPGASITFPDGDKLIVHGTLKAVGTSGEKITFDRSGSSNWYGIKFEDSSDDSECILEHCVIKHCSYAVYCNHAAPTIRNCEISYSMVGLYGYYSNSLQPVQGSLFKYNSLYGALLSHPQSMILSDNDFMNYGTNIKCYYSDYSTTLRDNDITQSGASAQGILFDHSSPIVIKNMIYDNNRYGVNCINTSSPQFIHEDVDETNNVFAYNAQYGVITDATSLPKLSDLSVADTAYNSIYSNRGSYDIYNGNATSIPARCNWWGQNPPNSGRFYGGVDYTDPLSEDPNPTPPSLGKSSAGEMAANAAASGDVNKAAREIFERGYAFELKGEWRQAIDEYDVVVDKYPAATEALMALVHAGLCYDRLGQSESRKSEIAVVASTRADYEVGGLAALLDAQEDMKEKRGDDALAVYFEICLRENC